MHGFDASNPPFDRLNEQEVGSLTASIDIGYFAPGEVIVRRSAASERLHVIIKGAVEVKDGADLHAVLGPKDTFDSRALVHGAAGEDFVAAEETLCYLVPRERVLTLIRDNPAFAAFFYADVSRKLDALSDTRKVEGMESVLRERIRNVRRGPAVFVEGATTIEEAGRAMRDNDINSLFVREGTRVGVVTGMNLSKAVVLDRLPLHTPVRDLCRFEVVSVDSDDFIFDALLAMTRYGKRRLAIRADGAFVGFLEDIDLLGLFAGNSQLIPGRIDRARGLDDLAAAARDIQDQVERLHRQGLKVDLIAEITSDLNRRLHRKLFEMVATPGIRENGCLVLLGSEGRGEQTARTDQDNALLLARELPAGEVDAFRSGFSGALAAFGFPTCPGNVMVNNPVWSQSLDGFLRQLRLWVLEGSPEAAMNIAIFFDAAPVAGDSELATQAKRALVELMRGENALIARFAHLTESFATPSLGLLDTLMASVGVASDEIDLKRSGIFPIVHGVRALAVDKGILAPSTVSRVADLVAAGTLEPPFSDELVSALRVFMEFRLRSQLRAIRSGKRDQEAVMHFREITPTDRDLLRDALRIVREFRDFLRIRYHFGAF